MRRMNRLVRGCLVLILAGCIILGAGAIFAITHFGLAGLASARPNVVLNWGPLHIGSPCAQLQASYPTFRCKSSYYVVLKVSKSQLWSLEIPLPTGSAVGARSFTALALPWYTSKQMFDSAYSSERDSQ